MAINKFVYLNNFFANNTIALYKYMQLIYNWHITEKTNKYSTEGIQIPIKIESGVLIGL